VSGESCKTINDDGKYEDCGDEFGKMFNGAYPDCNPHLIDTDDTCKKTISFACKAP
jgi:hypothetical protein